MWTLVKHTALIAFAAMAVLIALRGNGDLVMTAGYAGTALLTIVTFAVADRVSFLARFGPPCEMGMTTACLAARDAPGGYAPVGVSVTGHVVQVQAQAPMPAAPAAPVFRITVT